MIFNDFITVIIIIVTTIAIAIYTFQDEYRKRGGHYAYIQAIGSFAKQCGKVTSGERATRNERRKTKERKKGRRKRRENRNAGNAKVA